MAAELGWSVAHVLDEMSYPEIMRWAQYEGQQGGFGWRRIEVMVGQVCAIMANVNRDAKKQSKPFQIQDFMLFDKPVEEESLPNQGAHVAPETIAFLFSKVERGN